MRSISPTGASTAFASVSSGPLFRSAPSAFSFGEEVEKVHFYVMTYATNGSMYANYFSDGDLTAVHIIHRDYPSVMSQVRRNLDEYTFAMSFWGNGFPVHLKALERQYLMKVVDTSGDDPDNLGVFKENRIAVYVRGDDDSLKALFKLFDGFVAWKCSAGVRGQYRRPVLKFHLPESCDIAFHEEDQMQCTYEISKEDFSEVVSVFDAAPPIFPGRLVCAHIESESKSHVSIVFSGNTWLF